MSTISPLRAQDGIAILQGAGTCSDLTSWCAALSGAVAQAVADPGIIASIVLLEDWAVPRGGAPSDADLDALRTVAARLESSTKPTIAAMAGVTTDIALELALACHGRIAVPSASFIWTQAAQGLMPCAGGTQRLPRLVGMTEALAMLTLGKRIPASQAYASGMLDAVAVEDLTAAALAMGKTLALLPTAQTRDRAIADVSASAVEDFLAQHARKFRGPLAPRVIAASVQAAGEGSFEEGLRREAEGYRSLRDGPQHAALLHAKEAAYLAGQLPELSGLLPRSISTAGVIGAGTMGTGIAIALLNAGFPVSLYESDEAALGRGVERINRAIESNVRSNRVTRSAADAALASLSPVLDMGSLANADLIIEAAYETMEVKQSIFGRLDRIAKPGALLASNTSYLDIDAIAKATDRRGDVLGLHFFSPANIMKLLEIVRGSATAPEVLATGLMLAQRLGKVAVVAGNAYGFIGNRMLAIRRAEAETMAVEGASPQQIDHVLEDFGFAMGPFRMGDLAGLDLGWSRDTSTGATIRERLCEAGRRGQKTGAGFYDYDEAGKPLPSQDTQGILAAFAHDKGITRRQFDDQEILDRLLWPMVDEGARLLKEGIARSADDIDVVWLNGFGWPAWTGGPMYHARATGLSQVCLRLEALGRVPSPALQQWAAAES